MILYITVWENGESMPKTSTILKLAEVLGFDGNELIGFEVKGSVTPQYNNAEIDKLKSENAILPPKLKKSKYYCICSPVTVFSFLVSTY